MARKIYDAAVSTGEYTAPDGSTKKRWLNVGAVFEHDGGGMSMKLETVPVGPDWSGWISFFEPRDRAAAPAQPTPHQVAKANAYVTDNDIPF